MLDRDCRRREYFPVAETVPRARLLAPITDVVKRGALYIGWSEALTLLAQPFVPPTICRLSIARFRCAKSVPVANQPALHQRLPEGHKGETREQRIRELLVARQN